MLPRGRPRALGAAALLLLLLLIGFFLLGGDLECARRARGGPGSFPCALTPRIPPDGRPRGAAALDRHPQTDRGAHNRSDCAPPRPLPLPPKCEVGVQGGPLAAGIPGRRAPAQPPGHLATCGNHTPGLVASQLGAPGVRTSPYRYQFPHL